MTSSISAFHASNQALCESKSPVGEFRSKSSALWKIDRTAFSGKGTVVPPLRDWVTRRPRNLPRTDCGAFPMKGSTVVSRTDIQWIPAGTGAMPWGTRADAGSCCNSASSGRSPEAASASSSASSSAMSTASA